jgi:hypothetical protein
MVSGRTREREGETSSKVAYPGHITGKRQTFSEKKQLALFQHLLTGKETVGIREPRLLFLSLSREVLTGLSDTGPTGAREVRFLV